MDCFIRNKGLMDFSFMKEMIYEDFIQLVIVHVPTTIPFLHIFLTKSQNF